VGWIQQVAAYKLQTSLKWAAWSRQVIQFNFKAPNHISGITDARIVKILTQVGYIMLSKYHPLNGRGYSHMTVFKFCCLLWCIMQRRFVSDSWFLLCLIMHKKCLAARIPWTIWQSLHGAFTQCHWCNDTNVQRISLQATFYEWVCVISTTNVGTSHRY